MRRPDVPLIVFRSWSEMRRWIGSAGVGYEWHHIVERRLADDGTFPPEMIHATDNVVALPKEVHQCVSDEMSRNPSGGSPTNRKRLGSSAFHVQFNQGLELVRQCLQDHGYDPIAFE